MKHLILALWLLAPLAGTAQTAPLVRLDEARQAEKIDSIYPFDIALRRPADSSAINSREALPQNGRPTVLAFWLTTCYPCMMELSAYAQKWAAWQQETPFNLVAISTDWPERFRRIGEVATEKSLPFPVFWDANREFKEILPGRLNGLPQVFVYDKNGRLAWHHRRYYSGFEDELFLKIKELSR